MMAKPVKKIPFSQYESKEYRHNDKNKLYPKRLLCAIAKELLKGTFRAAEKSAKNIERRNRPENNAPKAIKPCLSQPLSAILAFCKLLRTSRRFLRPFLGVNRLGIPCGDTCPKASQDFLIGQNHLFNLRASQRDLFFFPLAPLGLVDVSFFPLAPLGLVDVSEGEASIVTKEIPHALRLTLHYSLVEMLKVVSSHRSVGGQ